MSIYSHAQQEAMLSVSAAIKQALADIAECEVGLANDGKMTPATHAGMVMGLMQHMLAVAEFLAEAAR